MNHKNTNPDCYITSDLALATAISLHHPIISIDKTNSNKALFIFKDGQDIQQFLQEYWSGTVKVNPLEYFNQLRNVKSRLYEERSS